MNDLRDAEAKMIMHLIVSFTAVKIVSLACSLTSSPRYSTLARRDLMERRTTISTSMASTLNNFVFMLGKYS